MAPLNLVFFHPAGNQRLTNKTNLCLFHGQIKEKKLRAAGVSNFNLEQMQELLEIAEIKPAVLQANSGWCRRAAYEGSAGQGPAG